MVIYSLQNKLREHTFMSLFYLEINGRIQKNIKEKKPK